MLWHSFSLCTQGCSPGSLWRTQGLILHSNAGSPIWLREHPTPSLRSGFIFGIQAGHILRDVNWPDRTAGFNLALTPSKGLQEHRNLAYTITNNPEQGAIWPVWERQNSQMRKCGRGLKICRYFKCYHVQRKHRSEQLLVISQVERAKPQIQFLFFSFWATSESIDSKYNVQIIYLLLVSSTKAPV